MMSEIEFIESYSKFEHQNDFNKTISLIDRAFNCQIVFFIEDGFVQTNDSKL